jgi:hypothetical protein
MSLKPALLVLSCDKYSDLWDGFFECFWENFPSENFNVYLGSNTKKYNDYRVTTLFSGKDIDWSTCYRTILEQIPEQKIFVILEDLYIITKISSSSMDFLIKFIEDYDANFIRYWANPGSTDLSSNNFLISEIEKGAPYRSTVCGFWDKNCLLNTLINGENPWNFEIFGSYRTSYLTGFYSLQSPLANYKNMVQKGRWIPSSVKWAVENNISINIQSRKKIGNYGSVFNFISYIVFNSATYIPWKYRVNIMNIFRRILVSY